MQATIKKNKPGRRKRQVRKFLPFYLMALPGIIYLIINNYMPLVGLQVAFKRFNYGKGLWGSDWNGLQNFEFLFSSNSAERIIRNTLLYNIAFILLGIVVGVAVAVLLNEVRQKWALKTYQTGILLPYLMSMVIISYLAYVFLSTNTGVVNGLIRRLGGENINWYNSPQYWPGLLIFINLWKNLGFCLIIFLSALQTINPSIYEAAEMEGCSQWECFWKITIPMVSPMILVNWIYTIVDRFVRADNEVMQKILDTMNVTLDYGFSSAMAWIYCIAMLALIGISTLIISRMVYYYD